MWGSTYVLSYASMLLHGSHIMQGSAYLSHCFTNMVVIACGPTGTTSCYRYNDLDYLHAIEEEVLGSAQHTSVVVVQRNIDDKRHCK